MFFRADGTTAEINGLFHSQSAFLLCGGPSLVNYDFGKLQRRGILTMAVNNSAVVVRPQLWTCVDDPANFCDAIWRDPAIWKFVPCEYFEKPISVRDASGELAISGETVRELPAVFGYRRNEDFSAERFLQEPTFNWGNHGSRSDDMGNQGSRSVMYVALKLLYCLGVRRGYLLGCDFRMKLGTRNYAFEQDRSMASVKGNNETTNRTCFAAPSVGTWPPWRLAPTGFGSATATSFFPRASSTAWPLNFGGRRARWFTRSISDPFPPTFRPGSWNWPMAREFAICPTASRS
jgi:hypothetical protein